MHESTLMKGLMRQIISMAAAHRAERIASIQVTLGALSNITPSHFTGHFVEASRGSVAEGARLDITCSDNFADPHAQDIMITGLEVA
jgi:hydrogenase nickel incorporation protein HypA/HybF